LYEEEEEGETALVFMATVADYSRIRTCSKLLW